MAIRQQAGVIVLGMKVANGMVIFNSSPEAMIQGSNYLIVIGEMHS